MCQQPFGSNQNRIDKANTKHPNISTTRWHEAFVKISGCVPSIDGCFMTQNTLSPFSTFTPDSISRMKLILRVISQLLSPYYLTWLLSQMDRKEARLYENDPYSLGRKPWQLSPSLNSTAAHLQSENTWTRSKHTLYNPRSRTSQSPFEWSADLCTSICGKHIPCFIHTFRCLSLRTLCLLIGLQGFCVQTYPGPSACSMHLYTGTTPSHWSESHVNWVTPYIPLLVKASLKILVIPWNRVT